MTTTILAPQAIPWGSLPTATKISQGNLFVANYTSSRFACLQTKNDHDKASSSHRFSTNNQQAALKIYHCHFPINYSPIPKLSCPLARPHAHLGDHREAPIGMMGSLATLQLYCAYIGGHATCRKLTQICKFLKEVPGHV